MSAMTDLAPSAPGSLPLPRRSTPSQISPRAPLSPDGGVFDIMSLPKVYARAAGIGPRSPPLSADKETFAARTGSASHAAIGGKASYGPGSGAGGTGHTGGMMAGGVDRKGKGRAVDAYDPFVRPLPAGYFAPTSPDAQLEFELGNINQSPSRHSPVSRKYAPPKKPLTPRQLSRIAQSFGIAIPLDSLQTDSRTHTPLNADSDQSVRASRASPIASSSRVTLDSSARSRPRSSPYLVTVVPPASLLPPGETSEAYRKRWARGRLVPLQPTYAGMMAAIAREFGLPGVLGLTIYLRDGQVRGQTRARGEGQETAMEDRPMTRTGASGGPIPSAGSPTSGEGDGPMVTAQTWSALFGAYASHPSATSRGSTPTGTPRSFHLTHDLASDTSLPGYVGSNTCSPYRKGTTRPHHFDRHVDLFSTRARLNSLPPHDTHDQTAFGPDGLPLPASAQPSAASAAYTHHSLSGISDTSTSTLSEPSLPTPPYATSTTSSSDLGQARLLSASTAAGAAAAASVIVATLEVDVDEDAPWMGEWYRRLEQAKRSGRTMPSMRDQIEVMATDGTGVDSPSRLGVRVLQLPGKVSEDSAQASSPRFMLEREQRELDRDRNMANGISAIPTIHVHAREPSSSDPAYMFSTDNIQGGLMANADLLASPIHLGLSPDMATLSPATAGPGADGGRGLGVGGLSKSMLLTDEEREMLQRELAKRGSALVMSDQLDDLEKMMRQLSPRNISMTSPRQMTPNTAARIATSTLTMPVPSLANAADTSEPIHDDMRPDGVRRKTLSSSSTATSSTTTSTHRDRNGSMDPKAPHAAWAITANKSAASINTFATTTSALSSVPSFDATTLSRPPMEAAFEEYQEEEMTSPRLRKTSGGTSLGSGRGGVHGNANGGEYFRPTVIARGIDEEQGEGRFKRNRDRNRNGHPPDGEEPKSKGKTDNGPLSPGARGSGRGFLGRSRSKSKSKRKSKEGVPFPPMSPDATASGRPEGDVPTSAGLSAHVQQPGAWKPSRPQRPPSPDFNDPAWSAGLSSPEFAFSPEMAEKVQAGSIAGSPHTPVPGAGSRSAGLAVSGQGMKQFSPFTLAEPAKSAKAPSAQTGNGNGTPQTPRTPMSPSTDESPDTHTPRAGDAEGTREEAGERKKPRSGSISLKGLRHMGSRSFGRKEKERPPALPLAATAGSNGRTSTGHSPAYAPRADAHSAHSGYAGHASPERSTFPGSRAAGNKHEDAGPGDVDTAKTNDTRRSGASGLSGAGEFGHLSGDAATTTTTAPAQGPSSGKDKDKENGFSRLFGFGNRKSTDTARSANERERDFGVSITWNQSGGNGNGNGSGEKRLPGAKMLAGLGLGHVRGRSGDHIPRLGASGSNGGAHPGTARSISGPVSVTMTSSASAGGIASLAGRTSGEAQVPVPGQPLSSGLRGSPSYNSFAQAQAQAQAQARGSSEAARGTGTVQGQGQGPGHVVSGWDGLAELHRATTGASAVTVTQGSAAGMGVPPSPASPRSVRRKPVPGHAS